MNRFLVYALGAFLVLSCATKRHLASTDNRISKEGVIGVSARWVKDKGDKFDIGLDLENENDKDIIVLLRDMHCFKGEKKGKLMHTKIGGGEKTIDMAPGEIKRFTMVCEFDDDYPREGKYKIVLRQVFLNKEGDGVTRDRSLASDVSWTLAPEKD